VIQLDNTRFSESGERGFELLRAEVFDESAGGLGLRGLFEQGPRPNVGELIALRHGQEAEPSWTFGVIRRMQARPRAPLELGVQYLAPEARAVAIRAVDSSFVSDYRRCLIVPDPHATSERKLLIAPRNTHVRDRRYVVNDGKTTGKLVARRLVEAGRRFEIFEIALA
jgi:hypothetical protein